MAIYSLVALLLLTCVSFLFAIAWTPLLSHYLYKYKCWKKKIRSVTVDGRDATITAKIEQGTNVFTPRMGGLLVVVTTLCSVCCFSGSAQTPLLRD